MDYIRGVTRSQVILFPESVEDYITEENPVRFIDAFVFSLDLAGLGFNRAQPAETGRPAYDPGDLLRLYLYDQAGHGYFLMRGLNKVGAEMSLTILSYNIKRVINLIGVKKMIEAVT